MLKFSSRIIEKEKRNLESVAATLRALTPILGRNSRPSRQAVTSLVKRFESTYSLCDVAVPVRLRVGRSVENIAAVETSVANDPNQSIPRRSQELGIAKTTLWRILRKDLTLHPYKIRLTQELKPMDHSKRRTFSDWALEKMRQDDQFHRKIIFSDEAHFWLNGGYVKSLVYANKPTTLEELKANIEREIAAVSAEMCGRVVENWVQRIDHCKRARGGHMSEVEFHS
ncbi:putative DD41D transposase [Trichonephila inaurata madagascariensis]|uniref:Putative DD41D transposase n=1 Tax=Trichonephila inaurata madagascariensis TaxID=2747483 RepID=A0A8X6IWI0_9ARAC|nr:putative DD41D transposase [Trichonephila inaurata madagascariensis]GFY40627.1 putative DD41D transposase [Trichonephila inaurata madagascariensis]